MIFFYLQDRIIDKTPPLKDILRLIVENNFEELKPDIVDLLHWAVVALREPILKTIPKIDVSPVISEFSFQLTFVLHSLRKFYQKFHQQKMFSQNQVTFLELIQFSIPVLKINFGNTQTNGQPIMHSMEVSWTVFIQF